jgi:hypothetical protein
MRFARSSASISCRHMRFARSSVTVDVRRFARIYVEYACTVCMCIYICVCVRVSICICLNMYIYIYAHVRLHIRGYVKCASGQMWEYMERQRSELCVGIYVIMSGYVRVSMFVRMFILRAGIQITIGGSYCRVHLATPT